MYFVMQSYIVYRNLSILFKNIAKKKTGKETPSSTGLFSVSYLRLNLLKV